MMLFETQVKKSKPCSGAGVPGLLAIAKGAKILDLHERAAAVGAALMKIGGGASFTCANPRSWRAPADDERVVVRKAVGAYIDPPIGRALQKIPGDPRDAVFTEPMPQVAPADLAFLWSPVVDPDLRANLIHAVKVRPPAGSAFGEMLAWDQSCADLKAAIEELIERTGPPASALSRILNGGAGGALAQTKAAKLRKDATAGYNAAIRKFHDLSKYGDGDDAENFDWFSYGKTQLHGHFSGEDIKIAEMWRGSIARAPKLVNSPDFHAWGARMIKRYGLSGPRAEGVVGYVCGAFRPAVVRKR